MSVVLRQPYGFERLAFEPERMQRAAQRQMVLHPEEASVSQPVAVVDLSVERDATSRSPPDTQPHACEDAIVANRGQPPHLQNRTE